MPRLVNTNVTVDSNGGAQSQAGYASQDAARQTKQISDKAESDKQLVLACVASAEQQGKTMYSDFKRNHKREASAAESLMTAWLTNVDEITFDKPVGSDATDAAWKTAKAHAELSSL